MVKLIRTRELRTGYYKGIKPCKGRTFFVKVNIDSIKTIRLDAEGEWFDSKNDDGWYLLPISKYEAFERLL